MTAISLAAAAADAAVGFVAAVGSASAVLQFASTLVNF